MLVNKQHIIFPNKPLQYLSARLFSTFTLSAVKFIFSCTDILYSKATAYMLQKKEHHISDQLNISTKGFMVFGEHIYM